MSVLLTVILPVFVLIGFGYAAARAGWLTDATTDGIMRFAQSFALPVLLFSSIAAIDLRTSFAPMLLGSFYAGAFLSFFVGWWGAIRLFGRSPEDAVAIGFACLFSNSLLLGVPITQRAWGDGALAGNFAIISIHSPVIYTFGISFMEFTRARGLGLSVPRVAARALVGVLRTPLVIGILCGFAVNGAQAAALVLPDGFWAAVTMMKGAALPSALFGLGAVLTRYHPRGDVGVVAMCALCSLALHPAVTWVLAQAGGLPTDALRSAVVTAAMPPGVNAFMFATMYGRAQQAAASAILVATALSLLSIWFWLAVLP